MGAAAVGAGGGAAAIWIPLADGLRCEGDPTARCGCQGCAWRACQASTIAMRCIVVGWVSNRTYDQVGGRGSDLVVSDSSSNSLRAARGSRLACSATQSASASYLRVITFWAGEITTWSTTQTNSASGTARAAYIPPRRRVS